MRIVALLTGIAILLIGCVHSRVLSDHSPPDTLAQINRDFAGRSAQIKLESGEYVKVRLIRIGNDSLIYALRSDPTPAVFPNGDVERVIVHDRRHGLIEGLVWGAGIGAAVGVSLGFIIGEMSTHCYDCPREDRMTPAEGMLYGAIAGAIPGAGLGMLMGGTGEGGAIFEVRYVFPAKKSER